MTLSLRELPSGRGMEITGVDLSQPLDGTVRCEIQAAFNTQCVLVFPGQQIDDAAHVRFARHLGKLMTFGPATAGKPPPEIFRSSNTDEADRIRSADAEETRVLKLNWLWHADGCYRAVPPAGVVLRAVSMVSDGGDTEFADNAAAYDALPSSMRRRIEGLVVRHSLEFLIRNQDVPPLAEEEMTRLPSANQPLVSIHSDGRRSLFLSPPYMETILGWTRSESRDILDELTTLAGGGAFTYRHRWLPGDVVVWNNHRSMHRVLPFDLTSGRRTMHGATLLGT